MAHVNLIDNVITWLRFQYNKNCEIKDPEDKLRWSDVSIVKKVNNLISKE